MGYDVNIDEIQTAVYIEPIFKALIKNELSDKQIESIYFDVNINNYFDFLPDTLKNNPDFILKAIDKGMIYYDDIPTNYKNNNFITKKIYIKMLEKNLINIQSNLYPQDFEICSSALNGNIMNFASFNQELKDDKNIIKLALIKNTSIFNSLSDDLKKEIVEDTDLIKNIVINNPKFFWNLDIKTKLNSDVLSSMLDSNAGFVECKHVLNLVHDEKIVLKALVFTRSMKSLNQKYIMVAKKFEIKENHLDFFKAYFESEKLKSNIDSTTKTSAKIKL